LIGDFRWDLLSDRSPFRSYNLFKYYMCNTTSFLFMYFETDDKQRHLVGAYYIIKKRPGWKKFDPSQSYSIIWL